MRLFETRRGTAGVIDLAIMVSTGGVGFLAADAVDRLIATYNPAGATRPTDKFTSDGAGTLGNVLNVGGKLTWQRGAASVGAVVVPAVGAAMIRSPMARSAATGLAIGAGINTIKLLWQNLIMPMLAPKDMSPASLQKSILARLYPAEVSAYANRKAAQMAVSSQGSGALSGPGVGDPGPFALAGDSPYPDTAQALRREAGVQGGDFPSLQNVWGTGGPGSDFPTAAQAMGTGEAYEPGPPPGPGPGPQAQPHGDPECACLGDGDQYAAFMGVGDQPDVPTPFIS